MEVFSLVLPWEEQLLMPINDIQYDGPEGVADLKRLSRHLAWGMERNALFIGLGDFIDFMSPSNRERYAGANLYTNARETVDRMATILEDELMHVLAPTRGRWVGLFQGHHYFEHLDGTSSDTRFAEALDTKYLGDSALGRIRFRDKNGATAAIKVFAHHGSSATTANGAMTKLKGQKAFYPHVRLFLAGHVPQLDHKQTTELDINDNEAPIITATDTHYVVCGGFARSFKQGSTFAGRPQGGYAEKAMMGPATIGGAVIHLKPTNSRAGWRSRQHRSNTVDVKIST